MRRWSLAAAIVGVVVLLTSLHGQQQAVPRGRYVNGELLVKFNRTTTLAQRNGILSAGGANRFRRFEHLDVDHVRIPPGLTMAAAIDLFSRMPGVVAVQPNYVRRKIQNPPPPDDPFWLDGSLWGLEKIQAPQAWTGFTVGDGSVIVADIDTGIDYTHPDLAANMWHNPLEIPGNGIDDDGNGYVDDVYGIDTVNHDSDPFDDEGHGTHTAGTIAAVGNNTLGVVGVNWNARLLACKFLSADGEGSDAGATECFNYIVAMRTRGENIRVSSNSWGGSRSSEPISTVLLAAIDAAGDVGVINIFGAGNDGTDNDLDPFDPASYPSDSIVSVASSGPTDRRSFFSNFGATSVDLAAPGEDILSTYPFSDYQSLSGTSMSTPHVSGVAALLASMDPTLSVATIKALLMDNVDQSSRWAGRVVSGGRLNAYRAAQAVTPGGGNVLPVVSLTGPAEGASYKAPTAVVVSADASDSDGTVQKVSFYANGAPLGADTTSPYSVSWSNAAAGNYILTAVATDDRGGIAVSAPVHVVLVPNTPPTVTLTGPSEDATFTDPASVTLTADAADSDGAVASVAFYADGVLISTDATEPYAGSWNAVPGDHALTAVATDNQGATMTSTPVRVFVNPIPGRINVAAAANGGTAIASSILNNNYPASGAINGDRKGVNWGSGGGWNDGTLNTVPDWLEVDFNGTKLVDEIDLFSLQDVYSAPVEPTPAMTFMWYGVKAFDVQYWDGSAWVNVPGGSVTNNSLVWRSVMFAAVTTSKMRVNITGALNGYSRVMELEAWGVGAGGNTPPTVEITSPAEGSAVTAPATVTVNADASDSDGSVQQVTFYVNGAPIGTDTAAPYSVTWSGAATGSYVLTAVATDNQDATSTSDPIHVSITATNSPPTVTLTGPSEGAAFTAPSNAMLAAEASDSDGSIVSVAFFANGAPIGTDTTSPYSVPWTGAAIGSYTLTAVATDNQGATATSAAVHVTVNPIPGRINVAAAANGGVATASSILNNNYPASAAINGDRKGLNWAAGGGWNDGTSNTVPDWLEVDFNGTKLIDEVDVFSMQDVYSSPVEPTPLMTFNWYGLKTFNVQYWTGSAWSDVPNGAVVNNNLVWRQVVFAPLTTSKIRVFVTGSLGGYSRVMEMETWGVGAGDNTAPSVALTSPTEGAAFVAPANLTVTATASDSDGALQQVAFFANGALIGTDTASPYSVNWNGVAIGNYTLTAVATDNQGAVTTSAPMHVSVTATNVPPTVSIASPGEGASFIALANIVVNANAADSDGTVQQVMFFANGTPIGTDNSSPFNVAWNNVTIGNYTLTAVATDNQGATTTSAPIHIAVTPVPGRINVAAAANGGAATASSMLNANYPPSGAINGDRKGLSWGAGGGWNDGTANTVPDWLQVEFNGAKTIDEVDAFSMQDAYSTPAEPTPAMTFTWYGLKSFDVQYWTGTAWATVPNGSIANNTLVWRQVVFTAVTTTKIRLNVTGGLNGYSRVMELEAWGVSGGGGGGNAAPTMSLTSPAEAASFTVPASILLAASASDSDGTVTSVAFYADGALIGTDASSPYTMPWTASMGSHSLTAVATDNLGATTTSSVVHVSVAPMPGRVNVALAANGGVASASSVLNGNYPASGAINGDRKGLNWGAGGGWNDGTANTVPDWIEVDFNGSKTIDEIDVFSMQDAYSSPAEPTPTMTFTWYGLKTFEVQYWTGSAWAPVPGGTIGNNNLVWRQLVFTPVTTTKIRVWVTAGLNGYSRVMELEAWGVPAPDPSPDAVPSATAADQPRPARGTRPLR